MRGLGAWASGLEVEEVGDRAGQDDVVDHRSWQANRSALTTRHPVVTATPATCHNGWSGPYQEQRWSQAQAMYGAGDLPSTSLKSSERPLRYGRSLCDLPTSPHAPSPANELYPKLPNHHFKLHRLYSSVKFQRLNRNYIHLHPKMVHQEI